MEKNKHLLDGLYWEEKIVKWHSPAKALFGFIMFLAAFTLMVSTRPPSVIQATNGSEFILCALGIGFTVASGIALIYRGMEREHEVVRHYIRKENADGS